MSQVLAKPLSLVIYLSVLLNVGITVQAQPKDLPFAVRVETYRNETGDINAFALRLEQPFLAEEFEKSSYLRLRPLDDKAYLIYPRETKFEQKHAEFQGRLRGDGNAKLRLSYETVSENLDGSRKVDVREADIEISIPSTESGPTSIYREWAERQNQHFVDLLRLYPEETFFEYVLLQSKDRYGVEPPAFDKPTPSTNVSEEDLYFLFSGGLAVQQTLQRQTLEGTLGTADLNVHISTLRPPTIRSPDYQSLLNKKREAGILPQPHVLARAIPVDHYFLQFNSVASATQAVELSNDWGASLLRLFTVSAQNHHLREKYEQQLCVQLDDLARLNQQQVVTDIAFTGSDFFLAEGTDLTLVVKRTPGAEFDTAAQAWFEQVKNLRPDVEEREFNYRGHKVGARYTTDRIVSSFVVRTDEMTIFSNSHVAIRKIVDTLLDPQTSLQTAVDYQYLTTLLPPTQEVSGGYLYCSDAFLRHLFSPEFKIGEKRRRQALGHLVMLNNASLMYRMENGDSPPSLSSLVEGRFVNPQKIVCPQGGAYAFDASSDTATSSVFNRIKYLTPLTELNVLNVSRQEREEYERYKQRFEATWRNTFDPIAIRIRTDEPVQLQLCVLPFANSSNYAMLRQLLSEHSLPLDLSRSAKSAITSLAVVPGRQKIASVLQMLPGVRESLRSDPTLTDLSWLGDSCSIHVCDDDTVLEVDPTQLRPLDIPFMSDVYTQSLAAFGIAAMNYPTYVAVDVEDQAKALRLLEGLAARIFLEQSNFGEIPSAFDAYRLPDYSGHPVYVISFQMYALKLRFHVSLVNGQMIAATRAEVLHEVIDASNTPQSEPASSHALLQFNMAAMDKSHAELRLHWAEKSRQASHRNIMPIHTLIKLYGVDINAVNELADAKYGVTYFCPDGEYKYDRERDQVYSTVYGNRQQATQFLSPEQQSSFAKFISKLRRVTAALRFSDEALYTTIEIHREQ
ncbi:MAG: hypothetical protein KDB03_23150 [Planctomycetales bacterium]|nr:hypothetical protein [Planctomycetales bacterium]